MRRIFDQIGETVGCHLKGHLYRTVNYCPGLLV